MTETPEQETTVAAADNKIAVPLSTEDRAIAHSFATQQPTSEKVEQVYRNTLAVLATQHYLQALGITTQTDGDSWHPLGRVLEDVADLTVPSLKGPGLNGKLECRVIQEGDRTCRVPKSVQTDRNGYVVVQLDQPYQTAYLVGFVKAVSVSPLPLSYVQPMADLIEQFLDTSDTPTVSLSQWIYQQFEPDWEPPKNLLKAMGTTLRRAAPAVRQEGGLRSRLEKLYQQQSSELLSDQINGQTALLPAGQSDQDALVQLMKTTQNDNIRWQCADLLWEINPAHPDCPVMTAKDLGLYLTGQNVALAVGLLPKTNNTLLILARLYPINNEQYLPEGLKLAGLDESDRSFFEILARKQDNYIQFKFTAEVGDRFMLQITLEGASFSEVFVV
ncbi:MAG: DUF1822 family protein [Cyanobacteria bacterium J06560_5]